MARKERGSVAGRSSSGRALDETRVDAAMVAGGARSKRWERSACTHHRAWVAARVITRAPCATMQCDLALGHVLVDVGLEACRFCCQRRLLDLGVVDELLLGDGAGDELARETRCQDARLGAVRPSPQLVYQRRQPWVRGQGQRRGAALSAAADPRALP